MTSFARWCLVALAAMLVVAAPFAAGALPVGDSEQTADELLAQVSGAQEASYSGFVETAGALQLPVASRFNSAGALFGEQTRLRVWWRDADAWRVDRLLLSGETDLIHDGEFTTEFDYEDNAATASRDPDIRLPRTADLLPPALAKRALSDTDETALSRIPARRVAGIEAPGLRLKPATNKSNVDHVDLWADPGSGLALRVEIWSDGRTPDLTSEFRNFEAGAPPAERTTYSPADGTEVSFDEVLDIADASNQYAPLLPPEVIGGLAKTLDSDGAVGVYGTGLTQLIAIPLRGREAGPLREQIAIAPGSERDSRGTVLTEGILTVLLTGVDDDGGWLIAGTANRRTAARAATDLARDTVYVGDR